MAECGLTVQQKEGIHDGFQGIVDFVGNGGGEPSRRSQLFSLNERGLHLPLLRDVTKNKYDTDQLAAGIPDRRCAVVDANLAAIASTQYGVVCQPNHDSSCG